MTYPNTLQSLHINNTRKGNVMSEKIEWISMSQAERLPECQVTRSTLIHMIDRGDVPEGHYKIIPLDGGKRIVKINKNILSKLDYRKRGEYPRKKD